MSEQELVSGLGSSAAGGGAWEAPVPTEGKDGKIPMEITMTLSGGLCQHETCSQGRVALNCRVGAAPTTPLGD